MCVYLSFIFVNVGDWRLAICDSRNKHSLTPIQHWLINRFKLNWRRYAPQTSKNFYNTRTFRFQNRLQSNLHLIQLCAIYIYEGIPFFVSAYQTLSKIIFIPNMHTFYEVRQYFCNCNISVTRWEFYEFNCQFVRIESHHYFYCFFFEANFFFISLTDWQNGFRSLEECHRISDSVNLDRFNWDKSWEKIHSRFEYWIGIYGGYLDFDAF